MSLCELRLEGANTKYYRSIQLVFTMSANWGLGKIEALLRQMPLPYLFSLFFFCIREVEPPESAAWEHCELFICAVSFIFPSQFHVVLAHGNHYEAFPSVWECKADVWHLSLLAK